MFRLQFLWIQVLLEDGLLSLAEARLGKARHRMGLIDITGA